MSAAFSGEPKNPARERICRAILESRALVDRSAPDLPSALQRRMALALAKHFVRKAYGASW
jgi:hypothetical protein